MKKVFSIIIAALVALSFSGLVFAAEVKTDLKPTSPTNVVKVEKKVVAVPVKVQPVK